MDGKLEDLIKGPIQLTQEVRAAVDEADLFKQDCEDVNERVEKLADALRSVAHLRNHGSKGTLYDRPTRHVMVDVRGTLDRTLSVVKRCKRAGPGLTRPSNVVPASDFRKVSGLLEGSIGDVTWLLSVSVHGHYGRRGRMEGLPPIASTDPMLAWVWGQIALVLTGTPSEREDGANYLASLACENDRNRKLIIEEGGLKSLLKLLKHGSTIGCCLAAANALGALGADQECTQQIYGQGAIPVFIHIFENGPMKVQAKVAWAIGKMASQAPDAQSVQYPIESLIRPLVSLLVFETMEANGHTGFRSSGAAMHSVAARSALKSLSILEGKAGWNEITDMNQSYNGSMNDDQWDTKSTYSTHSEFYLDRRWDHAAENVSTKTRHGRHSRNLSDSYFHGVSNRDLLKKEREAEDPETQRDLKVQVTFALWKLAENNVKNSRKIASAKALLCFAKLLEKETGEVLRNTVMTVMEMAGAAERDVELRRFAFKPNSLTAKAVLDQLLRIAQNGSADLQVPCLKAIGCLSRTFPAKETKAVIELLVCQLLHVDFEVAAEAVLALQKFSHTDNFLHLEHSKTIVDSNAVPHLVRLVAIEDEDVQVPALILLCNLAMDAGTNDAFRATNVVKALKAVSRSSISQIQSVREVLTLAMRQLELYQAAPQSYSQNYY
ncbi:hypothetical protein GOP47_0005707 [Adiantum capillus-veneris]|uniref:DUF7792 domain-containing protein n=1 Tax=Adiantum capillus-veneris TaxID=13818 RepID=A0A9D4ZLM7_ADICA|nr:hypothetical protein GOP47_0005707 [Adiantum capillus-veneris]